MSKLSLRARALNASQHLPIYSADEIQEHADSSLINRAVPQMPTGMEKEEESEHHLQRAICAGMVIPTPEVFDIEDLAYYNKLYPESYKMSRELIHMQPFSMKADTPDYDMDSDDEHWINMQAAKLELTPQKFEEIMDRLEKGSAQTVVTLQEAKTLIDEDDDLIIGVYDYWLNKRLKTQQPLIPQVKTEARSITDHNPYIAFRSRTAKMQTKKSRKNNKASFKKLLRLKHDLSRALTLIDMVKRREEFKREYLHLSKEIFEKQYQVEYMKIDNMANNHQHRYKNDAVDSQELRQRREKERIHLQEQKREQQLFKKRNVNIPGLDDELTNEHDFVTSGSVISQLLISHEIIQGLFSSNIEHQLAATLKVRQILSRESSSPVNAVIQAGIVPKFVEFLRYESSRQLQMQAAWALADIASGTSEEAQIVIDSGAVPIFIQLLGSSCEDVAEKSCWAMGNVAMNSPFSRDLVLQQGILTPLLQLLSKSSRVSMTRIAVWCLSNLCRGKNPPVDFSKVSPCIPVLSWLLFHTDADVLSEACWAISYLSARPKEKIQAVIDSGVCKRLVELLMHPQQNIVSAALRAVGNIVTGDDVQKQAVINCQALPCYLTLMSSTIESNKKEACWTISNITAGNRQQIQAVIDSNIFPVLIEVMKTGEFKTRKEAACAVVNATSGGSLDQIRYLVDQGCITPFCDFLTAMDIKIIQVALNGLENILKVGEADARVSGSLNRYAVMIEECYGLDKIESLQLHENMDIYQKVFDMIEQYFGGEEKNAKVTPNVYPNAPQQQFQFNPAQPSTF